MIEELVKRSNAKGYTNLTIESGKVKIPLGEKYKHRILDAINTENPAAFWREIAKLNQEQVKSILEAASIGELDKIGFRWIFDYRQIQHIVKFKRLIMNIRLMEHGESGIYDGI